MLIQQPLVATNRNGQFDVVCTVSGGGLSGQAGAVRHGLSKALMSLRAGSARRAQEGRLPHPRLARGRAQEVRQGQGPPQLPVLQALIRRLVAGISLALHPGYTVGAVSRLPLTFACCRYDRMEAIREGVVTVEGVDLNCLTLKSGRDVFDRMVGGQEFDVAELSASEFISLHGPGRLPVRRAAGVSLAGVPARLHLRQHARPASAPPKDLEGKRVGLPLYTQTAAIWARGHLAHQFGVEPRHHPLGAGRGGEGRHARQAARAAAAATGRDRAERTAASRSRRCWRAARSTR